MCVSKVKHMTGRKTGCNRSRPVFFGFSIFQQTLQLATEKIQNLCNRNRWSGLLQLGSVRFRSFFQSSELDLRTLLASIIVTTSFFHQWVPILLAYILFNFPSHTMLIYGDSRGRTITSQRRATTFRILLHWAILSHPGSRFL